MNKKVFLYIAVGVLILALLLFTFFPGMIYAVKDFGNSDSGNEDICSPAPGYSEAEWIEHMGHHPNIYAGCLS